MTISVAMRCVIESGLSYLGKRFKAVWSADGARGVGGDQRRSMTLGAKKTAAVVGRRCVVRWVNEGASRIPPRRGVRRTRFCD